MSKQRKHRLLQACIDVEAMRVLGIIAQRTGGISRAIEVLICEVIAIPKLRREYAPRIERESRDALKTLQDSFEANWPSA